MISVRESIYQHIQAESLDENIISAIQNRDGSFAIESALWDYKEFIPTDAEGMASVADDIVAMHNTYGGYLFFGIRDESESSLFQLVGISEDLEFVQLKDKLYGWTNRRLDIKYKSFIVIGKKIGVLFVPKRTPSDKVLSYRKDGPQKNGRPIFRRSQVSIRESDSTVRVVSPEQWEFVNGHRRLDGTSNNTSTSVLILSKLPPRDFICQEFVGRAEVMSSLWQWYTDMFRNVIVLSGEGGIGKSSIAYEFLTRLVSTASVGHVAWMTAKNQQFWAESNEYVSTPATDYVSTESFIDVLLTQLLTPDEIITSLEDADIFEKTDALKKQLVDAGRIVVCVDDVDSLTVDEQILIGQTISTLSGASNDIMFIVTTRRVQHFSHLSRIVIPGFPEKEFQDYCQSLCQKLDIREINDDEKRQLHSVSKGSPLYAESILRLVRLGSTMGVAIQNWKSDSGENVRKAALGKEVAELGTDAKKVLLATAILGSSSSSEIRLATGFVQSQVDAAIQQLQAFYLFPSPTYVDDEPRFTIDDNVVRFIHEKAEMYFAKNMIAQVRENVSTIVNNGSGGPTQVALIVRQARSHIQQEEYQKAHDAILSGLNRYPENPRLIMTRSELWISEYDATQDGELLSRATNELEKLTSQRYRDELVWEYLYLARTKGGDKDYLMVDLFRDAYENTSNIKWARKYVEALIVRSRSNLDTDGYAIGLHDLRDAVILLQDIRPSHSDVWLQRMINEIAIVFLRIAKANSKSDPTHKLEVSLGLITLLNHTPDILSTMLFSAGEFLDQVQDQNKNLRNAKYEILHSDFESVLDLKRGIFNAAQQEQYASLNQRWKGMK
ncbi:MAG: putative DNA binding domain-containing protein [Rhodothermales bacterium]